MICQGPEAEVGPNIMKEEAEEVEVATEADLVARRPVVTIVQQMTTY